jgi:hypothetical protein
MESDKAIVNWRFNWRPVWQPLSHHKLWNYKTYETCRVCCHFTMLSLTHSNHGTWRQHRILLLCKTIDFVKKIKYILLFLTKQWIVVEVLAPSRDVYRSSWTLAMYRWCWTEDYKSAHVLINFAVASIHPNRALLATSATPQSNQRSARRNVRRSHRRHRADFVWWTSPLSIFILRRQS